MNLYHISDTPGIKLFEPRPAPSRSGVEGSMVWAIDREHLPNYLLPRECPRITFKKGEQSSQDDVERLIGSTGAERIIVVESGWVEQILAEQIIIYTFDSAPFKVQDVGAGYWVSLEAVAPIAEEKVSSPLTRLLREEIEIRITPSLWQLREAVADSSLEFSIIRMRNAAPPPEGFVSKYPVPT